MTTANDAMVNALDSETFVLCVHGLKAQNMTAQGNALGRSDNKNSSPERAAQKTCNDFVSPFQGLSAYGLFSQGVALGYHVIAFSARRMANICGSTMLRSYEIWHCAKISPTQSQSIL